MANVDDADDEDSGLGVKLQPEEIEKRFELLRTEENLGKLAKHLRALGMKKTREGVFDGRRVEYVKGNYFIEHLIHAHQYPKYPKSLPEIEDKELATLVATELVNAKDAAGKSKYFARARKDAGGSNRELTALFAVKKNEPLDFDKKSYFVWVYEGSMTWAKLGIAGIIFAFIAFNLMPLWPLAMKKGVWWMSVTFLILMTSFIAIRLLLYLFFWVFGIEFWILPNFFDDSLPFADCFKPLHSFKKTDGNKIFRVILIAFFAYVAYWGLTKPDELEGAIKATIQLKDDLYAGNITLNTNAVMIDDRGKKKTPSVSDLLKETEIIEGGHSGSDADKDSDEASQEVDINMDSRASDNSQPSNDPDPEEAPIEDENILGDGLYNLDTEL